MALVGSASGAGSAEDWDRTVEGYAYAAPPSIPESLFLTVLRENDSPIPQEEAAEMYRYAVEVGYDPAILLGHIRKETLFGTAGTGRPDMYASTGWSQYNITGIRCTSWGRQTACGSDRFGVYPSFLDAGLDHIDLMMDTGMYRNSPYPNPYLGKPTVADRIGTYAPVTDNNNVVLYTSLVEQWADEWRERARRESAVPAPAQAVRFDGADSVRPFGNPLQDARTVMTQGYGVGTHAPAATWGGIDLAIDGNGDGAAEPGPTMNAPIYATHSGVVRIVPNSLPAGNYLAIENDQYKTAYAHLQSYSVQPGQTVQRGEQIGTVGSTGMSSGPHLHYEVWEMRGGAWVNVNPLDFGGME
jgi:murein DD-endopeptidase MepM/ murein hydrolase activator NlpD